MQAQVNYVLNPSFEQYSRCPRLLNQIAFANHWNSIDTLWSPDTSVAGPLCMPDYCNACASYGEASLPSNQYFHHYARTGNGAVEIFMLIDSATDPGVPDGHSYLQGRLSPSLIASQSYCVTFYVTLEDGSGYAVDKIGAYLDDGSIDIGQNAANCYQAQTAFTPQILCSGIINDTLNWVKVQGSFTATGAESVITIGNFYSYTSTDKIAVDYSSLSMYGGSLYLIDDVSVITSDAVADAGPDGLVSPGSDGAFIGTADEGMPCTWYIVGDTVPIGYSGGLKVHPDTTTRYVVVMDLCGNVTRDTVVVNVAPAGVGTLGFTKEDVKISPNPAKDEVTIQTPESFSQCGMIRMYDMLGLQVYETPISSKTQTVKISSLVNGVYTVQVVTSEGMSVALRLIKE